MKKFLSLTLACVLALGMLAGCGGESTTPAADDPNVDITTDANTQKPHDRVVINFPTAW